MDHPDFRVRKKIFATLGAPDESFAMVKLTPDQQTNFVAEAPNIFRPVPGGWGRGGATNVVLEKATEAIVRRALIRAWRNTAPKTLARTFQDD